MGNRRFEDSIYPYIGMRVVIWITPFSPHTRFHARYSPPRLIRRCSRSVEEDANFPMGHQDEEVMRHLADGEAWAIRTIYSEHATRLHAFAYWMLRDEGAAEDAVQETFILAWNYARGYSACRGTVDTWLNRICRNACLAELQHRKKHPIAELVADCDDVASTTDVWDEVARSLLSERVMRAIATLPPEQQEVIEFAWRRGYSHGEVAERLALPLGTVKGRIRLAMRSLHMCLSHDY